MIQTRPNLRQLWFTLSAAIALANGMANGQEKRDLRIAYVSPSNSQSIT